MKLVSNLLLGLRQRLNESTAAFYSDTALINELYAAENYILAHLIDIHSQTGEIPKGLKQIAVVGDFTFEADTLLTNQNVGKLASTEAVYIPLACKILIDSVYTEILVRPFDDADISNNYELCLMVTNNRGFYVLGAKAGQIKLVYLPYTKDIADYITSAETILPEMCNNATIQKAYASILVKDKDDRYQSELKKADAIIKGLI